MAPYWSVFAILLVPWGAILKYLVWDFFKMPETLFNQYSGGVAEARAGIHARKFLPSLAAVIDSVEARKRLFPPASTADILTELAVDRLVKEALSGVSEGLELGRSFRRAQDLCVWVAWPWLVCVVSSVALVTVYLNVTSDLKRLLVGILLPTTLIGVIGGITGFGLFTSARNNLLRLLGPDRF